MSELNMKIAERQGWHTRDLNDNEHGFVVRGPNWVLVRPDGTEQRGNYFTEDMAWDDVPDWAHDVSSAIGLCMAQAAENGYELLLCPYPDFVIASYNDAKSDAYITHVEGPTVAKALCTLWLMAAQK